MLTIARFKKKMLLLLTMRIVKGFIEYFTNNCSQCYININYK